MLIGDEPPFDTDETEQKEEKAEPKKQKKKKRTMGFKVEEKFRIILVMKEVNLTNVKVLCVRWGFPALKPNSSNKL